MNTVFGETSRFDVIKRKDNSPYEWEEYPSTFFMGRPANTAEKRKYRVQQGVNGNTDSIFIITSNLPEDLKPGDHIKYLGKVWTIESTGFYIQDAKIVNNSLFSDKYIIEKCPKGINMQ